MVDAPMTKGDELAKELKHAKPDPLKADLLTRKNILNASLDAAVDEFKGLATKPESWIA